MSKITAVRVVRDGKKQVVTIWRDEGIRLLGGYVRDYHPTGASLRRLLGACRNTRGWLGEFGPEGFDWRRQSW